jgi:rhamnulokinase
MTHQAHIAFDLGAESGRAMLATLNGGRVELTEAHRFANRPIQLPSGLHWNLLDLWSNLNEGLRRSAALARQQGVTAVSLGVDTWGVDFALVGQSGQLLGLPFCYRDSRNGPAMQRTIQALGQAAIYDATGIQFMPINTLYQLVDQHDAEPALVRQAHRMLMIPDLLHYFFSGRMTHEQTIASTTQMVDPRTGQWATSLLQRLQLPTQMLGPIVPAGTVLGPVCDQVATEAGLAAGEPIQVILPGSHDTASAVAAVPVDPSHGQDWAYLSSGTWSLMGVELDAPVVSAAACDAGFTNERGVGGGIRLLKNIAGLWLVQQIRHDLARLGQTYDYSQLTDLAAAAEPLRTLVNTQHPPFAAPGDMLAKIDAYAAATGQPRPTQPGQYVRCCLESLALTYRQVLQNIEGLLGRTIQVLHIVGGGGRNALLNQMTADAVGRTVIVGPYEATAMGNALTQAIGHGAVRDLTHLRQIVRASSELHPVEPKNRAAFEAQVSRFERLPIQ